MVPSHVLPYKIERRACIPTRFCEHRPKISSPLVHRDSFPSLFSFPHTPRLAVPHSPDASLRFFRLLLLPLLLFVSRFQFISNFSFFFTIHVVINLIQLMEENETCLTARNLLYVTGKSFTVDMSFTMKGSLSFFLRRRKVLRTKDSYPSYFLIFLLYYFLDLLYLFFLFFLFIGR